MIEIRHRETGEVLYTSNQPNLRAAVEEAVAGGVSLRGANLYVADLSYANLADANLAATVLQAILDPGGTDEED